MRDDHAAACHGDDSTCIFAACRMCRGEFTIVVPTRSYLRWLDGELVQNAFPTMPRDERELLVSGICDKCFKGLFQMTLKQRATLIRQTRKPTIVSECASPQPEPGRLTTDGS
jgi:hypothetical protein